MFLVGFWRTLTGHDLWCPFFRALQNNNHVKGEIMNSETKTLNASKQTPYMLRWDVWVDKTLFEFYIFKSRVPQPPPARIFVTIEAFAGDPSEFTQSLCKRENPIKVLVKPFEEHLPSTVRYRQLGDRGDWQIGEPYIPSSLIPRDSHFLIIEVNWDLDSGNFFDAPTYRET